MEDGNGIRGADKTAGPRDYAVGVGERASAKRRIRTGTATGTVWSSQRAERSDEAKALTT